ncbi:unnamed protein product [Eruca vesicaria subsp. sativa]|uniref:S-protein homolog n=1 Tax=Eruca vesicaria subsp. sativa TaxID=29727 RepID=A0ABC8J406_ERUVS|nr:unnamed protein product [Eruca vesicaria subsp. sativa]
MAKMNKWQVYVIAISLFIHLAAAARVEGITEEKTVKISNHLLIGDTLTVHCKSKNDDLGVQTLPPYSSWSFKFRPAVFGTTLFFCNFKWGKESHWFNIYDDNRDGPRNEHPCVLCLWNIYPSLACKFDGIDLKYNLCYDWNK